jgi:hypothetical protein
MRGGVAASSPADIRYRRGGLCWSGTASPPAGSTDDEIHGLIACARSEFAAEPYPFAPALRPIREALAKLDPKPTPAPRLSREP